MNQHSPDLEEKTEVKTEDEIGEPPMYKVLLLNDDYTTMEFVIEILIRVFNKTIEEATLIMLKVHREGIGLCGIYTFEVAETKVNTVNNLAREEGFPLKCTMEKD
jgi:ATP-dependent Clp protease adaptor protein ClpS